MRDRNLFPLSLDVTHLSPNIFCLTADEFILGGDHLVYAGQIDEILELKETHGLVSANHHVFSLDELDKNRQLRTAYITFGSPLIGKTIENSAFESDNNMTLVAVARRGERINETPRKVVLRAGDTLLLECPAMSLIRSS